MIRVAILTVSDGVAAGSRQDTAAAAVKEWLGAQGWRLVEQRVVPDERAQIVPILCRWADAGEVDLALTLGGTGFGPRDVTPEATAAVLERPAPGLAEALRADGLGRTPYAALSRGVTGIRGRTLIVNLPGSERAVRQGLSLLEQLIPHAVDLLRGHTEH